MFDKSELQNLEEKRAKILAIIKEKGPSLPVQISREMGVSPILVSAFIAEMRDKSMLKLSNIKVGGSPLYFLSGQESMLDNFSKFLPQKERETFELLKKLQVLEDGKVMPAERVALRSMKDFAVPMKISDTDGSEIFWRFHTFSEEDASKKINEMLKTAKKAPKIEEEEKESEEKTEKQPKPRKTYEKKDKSTFIDKIKEYLDSKGISIEKINEGKDFSAIVTLNSDVGKIKCLALAKNKKKLSASDILFAQQQSHQVGLPILFLVNDLPRQEANFGPIIFKKIE
jgi:hypothetical protein